ncbi:MAG: tRNA (adenosine(37)-N6)-threonylcarbamoyltransferase complex dimerization subunit type 1 TsaB, partial [Gammaproteobacteria bacterium]
MRLIALDTATGIPTVCLWLGADEKFRWSGELRPGPDAVLAGARGLLAQAGLDFGDLDAVACGRGPGAFTGVRLAMALAQGLALGAGCPLIAVSELAALAWRAHRAHGWEQVVACLDARQGEVYWSAYECGQEEPCAVVPEALAAPRELVLPAGKWALAGSGAA